MISINKSIYTVRKLIVSLCLNAIMLGILYSLLINGIMIIDNFVSIILLFLYTTITYFLNFKILKIHKCIVFKTTNE